MEQVRSFIAIELPDEVKLALSQLQARLKPNSQPWIKWVDPYSIHLTLKFLGNIAVSRIGEITKAMEEGDEPMRTFGDLLQFHQKKESQGPSDEAPSGEKE